jgi:hypothetical protein
MNGEIMSETTPEGRCEEPALPEATVELLSPEELAAVGGGAFPFIQQA